MGEVLERVLVCPHCHGKLTATGDRLRCGDGACGFVASVTDGIVNIAETTAPSFFDTKVPVMLHGANDPGSYSVFYEGQSRVVTQELEAADVIVDVGCGPRLLYRRPAGTLAIGVDMSLAALRHNPDVDVRVWGSARCLPLANDSVDAVVCFYVLHHLVSSTVAENRDLLAGVFREFARVIRPGGQLLVCEVAPWRPVTLAQRLGWDLAKRVLKTKLDMFFWPTDVLVAVGHTHLPAGTVRRSRTFQAPSGTTFAPIFAVPWIRIPRFLYPFAVCLYHWRLPGPRQGQSEVSA
jgi:SAM-dependent methyltransferase